MKEASIYDCSIIELPRLKNRAGNITVVNNNDNIPFEVKRVFYIYDIPGGEDRGAHSHKNCHQFLVAVSGSFEVEMNDGTNKRTITLNRPYYGLYIPNGLWREMNNFSTNSLALVLSSTEFSEDDYIRDYAAFLKYVQR